jgi:hypothetical protein
MARGGEVTAGLAGLARRHAFALALAAVVIGHVALVFYFLPPGLVFSAKRLAWFDFEFHAVEIARVVEALDGWGRSWAWDPQLLAGYPEGTIFDADAKAWELFVFALVKAGVPQGLAFNLFVLLVHLSLPAVVYVSARLLDLGRWEALVATLMASLLWHFDTTVHLTWRLGTVTYAMAAYAGLMPLSALHAYLRGGARRHLALLLVSLALAHLLHPFVFVGLVLPMGVMYLAAARSLPWQRHAGVAAAVVCTLLVNSWWLAVLFSFRGDMAHMVTPWRETLGRLAIDVLGIEMPGNLAAWWGARRGFYILFMLAGVVGLLRWRQARDERTLPFAAGIGALLAAAYLGELVPGLEQTQCCRYVLPAMMLSVMPAASLAVDAARQWALRRPDGLARHLAILAVLLLALFAARQIVHFFPAPGEAPPVLVPRILPLGPHQGCSFTIPRHTRFRHAPLPRDFDLVAAKVEELDDGSGRFLVESWDLAEHIAWRTGAQVLGGFAYRNMKHGSANLFRRMEAGRIGEKDLARYLSDYNVKWVILNRPHPLLEELLEPRGILDSIIGGTACRHALFATGLDEGFVAGGRGRARASLNRIEVRGTDPASDAVLRFHFLDTFECRPGCTLAREPVIGDPVGFVRVHAPHPAAFTIVNTY